MPPLDVAATRARLREAERLLVCRWTAAEPLPADRRETAGLEAVRARAAAVDAAVREAWEARLAGRAGLTLLALGGYGRRELCPHSDVDLLFLRADRSDASGLEEVQAALWDLGLRLGAAVRTVAETEEIARRDHVTRTSLLEARLLAGDPAPAAALEDRLGRLLRASGHAAYVAEAREEVARRRARHGRVGLAEPNVKEGTGGLRDAHAALWVGRVVFGTRDLAGLAARGALRAEDAAAAEGAYALLLLVRWLLHARAGRKADVLTTEAREDVAARVAGADPAGLVRDVVRAARTLERTADQILRRAAASARGGGPPAPHPIEPDLEERGGEVFALAAPPAPALAVRAAAAAARGGLALAPSSFDAVRAAAALWEAPAACADAAPALRALLGGRRPGEALEILQATGALGALFPEFAALEGRVAADAVHRFTADAHTIEAIRLLPSLVEEASAAPDGPVARALEEAGPRDLLALALLLHDVGKGIPGPGDHVERAAAAIPAVTARLGLDVDEAAHVEFLVRAHLWMTRVAFRRDVDDPHQIAEFADRAGTPERLSALFLLTLCDVRAVSPDLWTDWKAALLSTLYLRAMHALEVRVPPEAVAAEAVRLRRAAVEAQAVATDDAAERERHFARMPPRYFIAFGPRQILRHLRLLPRLAERPFVLDLDHDEESGCTEAIVVTRDRVGLFAEIAGTLTSRAINILSAQIHTRTDGVVLDTFRVNGIDHRPVDDPERWRAVEADLARVLSGAATVEGILEARRPYAARAAAPAAGGVRVRADEEASPTQTVLEVEAPDEMGLLHRIAASLRAAGAAVTAAIVHTERGRAFDVFYVVDPSGRKFAPERAAALADGLAAALSE